ncbi:hypothetical protein BD626DRAFT_480467 [Schizophyllum amplum]|uniref:Uncharacterized protein n=1 Tax=Schizophyllum amplum TaxID=97359 RepID=A0A550CT72_9AGAR|nr:hypothetical protein BD626DRAFT_480467 [Auriculariopsis ampla]
MSTRTPRHERWPLHPRQTTMNAEGARRPPQRHAPWPPSREPRWPGDRQTRRKARPVPPPTCLPSRPCQIPPPRARDRRATRAPPRPREPPQTRRPQPAAHLRVISPLTRPARRILACPRQASQASRRAARAMHHPRPRQSRRLQARLLSPPPPRVCLRGLVRPPQSRHQVRHRSRPRHGRQRHLPPRLNLHLSGHQVRP